MTDFDALLTRSFAEAHEPADDGFSVNVGHAVARSERALKARNGVYALGMGIAGLAITYGAYAIATTIGQDLLASAGLEVARAHGALSAASSVEATSQNLMQSVQSMGVGLTQILLVAAALAGGAVTYRATQE